LPSEKARIVEASYAPGTVMTDVAGVSKATTFAIPLIVGTAEAPAKPAATPATGG